MHAERRRLQQSGAYVAHGHFALPVSKKRRLSGDRLNPSRVPVGPEHQAEIPKLDFSATSREDEHLSAAEEHPRFFAPPCVLLPPCCLVRRRNLEACATSVFTHLAPAAYPEGTDPFVHSSSEATGPR